MAVMDMQALAQAIERTERELQQERANALGRTSQALEALLGELQTLGTELNAMTGDARTVGLARFNELREKAKYRLWCLIVQREAIGLRQHRELEQHYVIPPVRRE